MVLSMISADEKAEEVGEILGLGPERTRLTDHDAGAKATAEAEAEDPREHDAVEQAAETEDTNPRHVEQGLVQPALADSLWI